MISMNSPLPPAPTPETLQGLFDLAKLLADPTAAAQRIADFKAAADELHAQSEEARTSQSALAADQVAHQQALEKASAEHAATLAQAQLDFDADCERRSVAWRAREQRLTETEAQLKADQEALAVARADLDERLAHLKAAVA